MSNIDEIKTRIDIVDLVSESGVTLKRSGRSYTGLCPFHGNTRTPAFVIWPETGTWRCFGECNEGGDIFKFVMKKEGWDFKEALTHLAERAGVQLQPLTPQRQEQLEEFDRLRALLEEAVIYYRAQMLDTPAGQAALTYLREKRALNDATMEAFGLGYAPNTWEATCKHFIERGYSEQELFDAGLLSERDSGGYYDRFRNRIMIPIRDERGRMAGFGARILDPDDVPKFLNSPQTPIFDKGRVLYGLDQARKAIRTADQAVIVEGYLDVIAVHQAGFKNVVSPMGTALTEDQLRLLKRFTPGNHFVLALDPDAAGQKAVLRGLAAARQAMDRETETGFDARGLLSHEARLKADLRVASLPDGMDPDEIVERDPQEWVRIIAAAKPIVTHVMETLAAEKNLDDPRARAEISAQVLSLINEMPNPVERDSYRQQLARLLRVDERTLIGTPAKVRVAPRRAQPRVASAPQKESVSAPVSTNPVHRIESAVLGILLHKPELVCRLDRALQEAGVSALTAADFEYTDYQMLLVLLRSSIEQDALDQQKFVMGSLSDELQAIAQALMDRSDTQQRNDDRLLEEVFRLVIKRRRLTLESNLNQIRFLQEDAQDQGDTRTTSFQELVLNHSKAIRDLDNAVRSLSVRRLE